MISRIRTVPGLPVLPFHSQPQVYQIHLSASRIRSLCSSRNHQQSVSAGAFSSLRSPVAGCHPWQWFPILSRLHSYVTLPDTYNGPHVQLRPRSALPEP